MKAADRGGRPHDETAMAKSVMSGIFGAWGALLMIALLLGLAKVGPAFALDAPPAYVLTYLGAGSPVAINNHGTVVGARLIGSNYEPLVSTNGAAWVPLPVPVGAQSAFPTAVNDNDVIVGVAYTAWVARAIRWRKPVGGGNYSVDVLPLLPGSSASYATAINNLGQIVGARSAMGYTPQGSGWLYSDAGGLVDLNATYGLAVLPTAINDAGRIIAGIELLDLNAGTVSLTGGGPANYNPVTAVAINNDGEMAGYAALRSSSLNVVTVFYGDGSAWNPVAGSSKYTTASSINIHGDIGYGELGAGLYLHGLGVYALNSLLSKADVLAGWAITGNAVEVNDQRVVATSARNSISGQTGGVLLTPVGSTDVGQTEAPLLTATPASGNAPLAVSFTSSASSALNGPLIRSYVVDYGDGSDSQVFGDFGEGTRFFSANSSHTYKVAGTYSARLTVNYVNAVAADSTVAIIVNAPPVAIKPSLRSTAIDLAATVQRSKVSVSGVVAVQNSSGGAGSGAVVSATWSIPGGATKTQKLTTDSTGAARFATSGGLGTYTLKVNSISKSGYSFDSTNSVLSGSITR